ncbi:MAG: FliM/FliN family flagellar motor switch protein [Planctomycetaceae bacterium]
MDERRQTEAGSGAAALLLTAAESAALTAGSNAGNEPLGVHALPPLSNADEPRAFELPPLVPETPDDPDGSNHVPGESQVEVQIELGRAEIPLAEAERLGAGSIVPLDKLAGDPVDILADGKLVARGEVVVLRDKLCVRVAEVLSGGWLE